MSGLLVYTIYLCCIILNEMSNNYTFIEDEAEAGSERSDRYR